MQRPMRQKFLFIWSSLSSSLYVRCYELPGVKIEPQYSAMISPLLKASLVKSPVPAPEIREGPVLSLSSSELGNQQCPRRMSSSILIIMQDLNLVSKEESVEFFEKQFEDVFNTVCYQCGRKTRQWVDVQLAIYLCLNCSALYKNALESLRIRCVSADSFSREELLRLSKGGNRKFKEFLSNYEMHDCIYRERLRTKAVEYYRTMVTLTQQASGRAPPMAPDALVGLQLIENYKSIKDMSAEQVLEEMKTRAFFVGNATKEYGSKAFATVSQKISSGELKEDAKKTAQEIGNKAKGLWEKLVFQVDKMTS